MYELFPTPGTFVWKNLVFLETIPPYQQTAQNPPTFSGFSCALLQIEKNFQKALEFLRIVWYTVNVERKGDDKTPRPPKKCARRACPCSLKTE